MPDLSDMLGILRAQAWERAKGELRSVLAAYISDKDRFDRMDALVATFIKEVEDEGLAE